MCQERDNRSAQAVKKKCYIDDGLTVGAVLHSLHEPVMNPSVQVLAVTLGLDVAQHGQTSAQALGQPHTFNNQCDEKAGTSCQYMMNNGWLPSTVRWVGPAEQLKLALKI